MIKARWLILALLFCGFVFAVPTGLSIEINGGDGYTNQTSVSISLSATDAQNCSLSNSASFSPNSTYEYASLPASWTLNSGDGNKTVYFKCVGSGGNWSSAVNDAIGLDTTAPSVSSKTPTGSVTDRTPEISASVSDSGSGVDTSSIILKLDGSTVTHAYSSGTVSYTPSSNLNYTSHSVTLLVADNLGKVKNETWSFTIASDGVSFDDMEPPDNNYTNTARPTISLTLVDSGSGINHASLVFKLDDVVVDSEDLTKSGNSYSYRPSDLDEGGHTVRVCVQDSVAKESCIEWDFHVDTEEPIIGLFVPSDGAIVTDAPYISAKIEDDGSGIDDDTLFMDLNGIDVTASADYDKSSETYIFSPSVDLAPGIYMVEIWASDKVGNDANVDWTFTVSSDAPTVSSLKPTNGSTVSSPVPQISVKITDSGTSGINTDSIKLYLDGSQITSSATFNAGSGILTYTPSSPLSDGKHTVRVRVRNNNYAETDVTWSFTIDASAPPSPDSFTVLQDENGTVLSWECSSSDVNQFRIYASINPFTDIEGKAVLATVDADTNEYEHDVTSKYYYAIVAEDAYGNQCEPLFASACDVYSETSGWTEYECCKDTDCDKGYVCDVSSHTCEVATGTTQEADADDAITDAEDAIQDAKKAGLNVTKAEDYLEDAQNAFNAGNFEQAEHFAQLAKSAVLSAEKLPGAEVEDEGDKTLPCCPSTFILIAALGFAALRR